MRRILGVLALAVVVSLPLANTSAPAMADSPAMSLTVERVAPTADAGSSLSFTVSYSCATISPSCESPVITLPAPVGVLGSGEYPVVAGSGDVTRNADVGGVTGTDPLSVALRTLKGGESGRLTVSWTIPNGTTPVGTTYSQNATLVYSGGLSVNASAPEGTTVTANPAFAVALATVTPTSPARVGPDMDVTYRVYDCNPTLGSVGSLGYTNLELGLAFPTGTVIVDPGGATVSGSTLTWTDAAPTVNACDAPDRVYTTTVRYPSGTFVPPVSNPPAVNTVPVTLTGQAIPIGGGSGLTDSARMEHTFTGSSPNTSGDQMLFYQWGSPGTSSQAQGLSATNTTTPYGILSSQWWWWVNPGEVQKPGYYQLNSLVMRAPCIAGGTTNTLDPLAWDPIGDGGAGTIPAQNTPCTNPAYSTERLEFRDAIAPLVWKVDVITWDGSVNRTRSWAPSSTPTRAFYLDIHDGVATPTLGEFDSDPTHLGGTRRADVPTPPDPVPEAPTVPMPQDPSEVVPPAPLPPEAAAATAHAPIADPGEPFYLNRPATDMTMTDPETIGMGISADEIVTDVRVVYRNVPYYTRVFAGIWGTTTPAFAALDPLQTSMTLSTRVFTNPMMYSELDHPKWGWLLTGNPLLATMGFVEPQPDPQVAKLALDDTSALAPGDAPRWQISVTNGPNGAPLNPKIVDVLPPGLELDPASIQWSGLGMLDDIEPTLTRSTTTEFGAPREVLTWTWPADAVIDNPGNEGSPDHPLHLAGTVPTVEFDTTVTLFAADGLHDADEAQSVTVFDGTRDITAAAGTTVPRDTHDLDLDGNRTERVAFASSDWTVSTTSGARAALQVRGDLDSQWSDSGLTAGTVDGSGTAQYRLAITNPNNSAVTDLTVYNMLPRVGDTAASEALDGERRGSVWTPLFAGITNTSTLPPTAVIAYSTSENPCRPELFPSGQGTCVDDWSASPPADLASVTALRITDDAVLPPTADDADAWAIEYAVTIPKWSPSDVDSPGHGGTANNNVAWRGAAVLGDGSSASMLPAEAPVVTLEAMLGVIGDFAWRDQNADGLQDPGEPGVAGVTVRLLDDAGEPVTVDGTALETTTDRNGHYTLSSTFGTYRVEFVLPDGERFTSQTVGDDRDRDSDADPATGRTAALTVSAADPQRSDIDAGVLPGRDGPGTGGGPGLAGTGFEPTVWPYIGLLLLAGGILLATRRKRRG